MTLSLDTCQSIKCMELHDRMLPRCSSVCVGDKRVRERRSFSAIPKKPAIARQGIESHGFRIARPLRLPNQPAPVPIFSLDPALDCVRSSDPRNRDWILAVFRSCGRDHAKSIHGRKSLSCDSKKRCPAAQAGLFDAGETDSLTGARASGRPTRVWYASTRCATSTGCG
jgi:hypothetical protein